MSVVGTTRTVHLPASLKIAIAVSLALILSSGIVGLLGFGVPKQGSWTSTEPMAVPRPGVPGRSTSDAVEALQSWLRDHPADGRAYSQLGAAYLQRGRETGDPGYYSRAEAALTKALDLTPGDFEAMISRGSLALTRHDFPDALAWAERARAINPYRSAIYGIIGDAHVELGEYDAAFDAFQAMMDRRPDLASYSRVSYARELLGDTDGAIAAMRQAVKLGPPTGENTAWCRVQLGNLYARYAGDLDTAEAEYRRALVGYPGYAPARAGLGRLAAARGDYRAATETYTSLVAAMPLPEFVITLGDLYLLQGRDEDAARQYALVRAIQELHRSHGVAVDLDLALFDADHEHELVGALSRAREQMAQRPSIIVALDAVLGRCVEPSRGAPDLEGSDDRQH